MWTVKVHASNKIKIIKKFLTVMLHIIITNDFIKLEISTKDLQAKKKKTSALSIVLYKNFLYDLFICFHSLYSLHCNSTHYKFLCYRLTWLYSREFSSFFLSLCFSLWMGFCYSFRRLQFSRTFCILSDQFSFFCSFTAVVLVHDCR